MTTAADYQIRSAQRGCHPKLLTLLQRHQHSDFMKPINHLQRTLFAEVMAAVQGEVILDVGCGTGMSTSILAQRFPQATVIGIDPSIARLNRHPLFKTRQHPYWMQQRNMILVQADFIAWSQLAQAADLTFERAYFFYPNPWPCLGHLQRRWYGHAIWPSICQRIQNIELRTNWDCYWYDWQVALGALGRSGHGGLVSAAETPITLFERKYQQAQVPCYQWISQHHDVS